MHLHHLRFWAEHTGFITALGFGLIGSIRGYVSWAKPSRIAKMPETVDKTNKQDFLERQGKLGVHIIASSATFHSPLDLFSLVECVVLENCFRALT